MNVPDAKKLAEELTDLPLILINTHADPDHISGNDGFDEIYAMHGSFPVKCDLIEKVIEGAQRIKEGKAEGSPINLFGKEIRRT